MSIDVLLEFAEAYRPSTTSGETGSPINATSDGLHQRFAVASEPVSEPIQQPKADEHAIVSPPRPNQAEADDDPEAEGMQSASELAFEVPEEELELGTGVSNSSGVDMHAAILETISSAAEGTNKAKWANTIGEEFKRRKCVGTSLHLFARACSAAGVDAKLINIPGAPTVHIPALITPGGKKVSHWSFLALWFGNFKAKAWPSTRREFRGKGAPGALAYAGIADGQIVSSAEAGWHTHLKPGALLQLYLDESVVGLVRDGDLTNLEALQKSRNVNFCGHSCILVAPPEPIAGSDVYKLWVADQFSPRKLYNIGKSNTFRYLLGCNLRPI